MKISARLQMFAWFFLVIVGCGREPVRELSGQPDRVSGPPRSSLMTGVTRLWGPLVIQEGEFFAESKIKPWSSWWYPVRYRWLFEQRGNELSTLQKYDLYAKKTRHINSEAAKYEETHIFNPNADAWEGLCDAWATAAVLWPEPSIPISSDGIRFSVSDLKALLIKTYENSSGKEHFGQRYNGDRESVFDDIYPDQFHRFVQRQLFEQGLPFIADVDPGVAVWNTPIWKAFFRIKQDTEDRRILHVEATLQGASSDVPIYDYVGTKEVIYQYSYDLLANQLPDGSFEVVYGEWTGDSLRFHPDFVTYFGDHITKGSRNTEIMPELVDLILKRSAR